MSEPSEEVSPLLAEATLDQIVIELGQRFDNGAAFLCAARKDPKGEKWTYRYVGSAFAIMGLLECSMTDIGSVVETLPERDGGLPPLEDDLDE